MRENQQSAGNMDAKAVFIGVQELPTIDKSKWCIDVQQSLWD